MAILRVDEMNAVLFDQFTLAFYPPAFSGYKEVQTRYQRLTIKGNIHRTGKSIDIKAEWLNKVFPI